MRIAELYASLQGEGLLAGTPSVFVRTSGCNLRCRWCDTPFTSWDPQGDDWPVATVIDRVLALGGRHAVVTGGEPLIAADVVPLCAALRAAGWHVTIETAGTVCPPGVTPAALADLMSISPKLASSGPTPALRGGWPARHEAARRRDDVLAALMTGPHQLKFVIDSPADFAEAAEWLDDLRGQGVAVERRQVFMMPQGRDPAELERTGRWLEPECRRRGFSFAPRHHIAWFGHTRGT
jgi:7-carboxy-7-deazaguanine synthase